MVISFPNMAALFASDWGGQQIQINKQSQHYLLQKIKSKSFIIIK